MIFQYTASHGVPPYTFEVLPGSGDLPPGMTLDTSTGELSASDVTATGSYSFTIRVTDSVGAHADQPDTIEITTADAVDLTGGAPSGQVGIPYTFAYTTTGGAGPYTYAVTSGTLPDGLSLSSSTGVLSGTPTTEETQAYTVTVTDVGGFDDHVDESVEIISGEAVLPHRYWRIEILQTRGPSRGFLLQQGKCGLSETVGGTFEVNAGQAASSEAFESVAGMFGTGSRWSTNFSGYEWVSIDLGTAKPIVELRLVGNSSFPERTVKDFNIQWSDDGATWTTSAEHRNVDLTSDIEYSFDVHGDITGLHRYWRINLLAGNGYVGSQICELQFRSVPGAQDMTNPTTALTAAYASNTFSPTFSPNKAFDNDTSTVWFSDISDTQKLAYDFGSPISIKEISIMPIPVGGSTLTIAAKDFNVEWSDDNSGWTVAWQVRNQVNWAAGEARISTTDEDPFSAFVSSLLNFEDVSGGVFTDETGKTWTPTGSVAINSTQPKWGTGAAQFSGGYISTPADSDFGFGAGEYTVEGWESNNASGDRCLFDNRSAEGIGIYAFVSAGSQNFCLANNAAIIANSAVTPNGSPAYSHWAVCKDNTAGKTYGYLDGIKVWEVTDIRTMGTSAGAWLGANFLGSQVFSGWLDSTRVTKGICRYPGGTNFAVQPGPFALV